MAEAILRPLHPTDIPAAQALTASFGWPHRIEDWQLMHCLGQGVVAEHDGQLAGTALCWRYGEDWATLGMIAVAHSLQGQGMGRRLMLALMQQLEGRSLALHATEAGLKLYATLGFSPAGTVCQHQGLVVPTVAAANASLRPPVTADHVPILALDRQTTGMDRTELLRALLRQPGGTLLHRDGHPAGFALVRRFGRGHVIGPVAATSAQDARAMITHLLAQHAGQFVRIDVPQTSALGPWLTALGLEPVGTVLRMVRGPEAAHAGPARIFALASQAFG